MEEAKTGKNISDFFHAENIRKVSVAFKATHNFFSEL
jgi:hypothetical protein